MNRRLGLALAVPLLLAAGKPQPDPRRATEWTVAPGETLGGIARKVEVPRVLIIEANALKAPFHVRIGQTLVIPRRRERVVKAGMAVPGTPERMVWKMSVSAPPCWKVPLASEGPRSEPRAPVP